MTGLWYRLSLWARLTLAALATLGVFVGGVWLLNGHFEWSISPTLVAMTITFVILSGLVFSAILEPSIKLIRALAGTVSSYQDRDYSFSIAWPYQDELAELVAAHNLLVATIRQQNLHLSQRELLLDVIIQSAPMATILFNESEVIVFANIAARKLLAGGARMEGKPRTWLCEIAPDFSAALLSQGDGLFSVPGEEDDELYQASHQRISLNGRPHDLLLLRQMTTELRRQEVAVWKKVIRVVSHEINNSLGPINSLARSGQTLLEHSQHQRLPEVLKTIAERAEHLAQFIAAYASISRLPAPNLQPESWQAIIYALQEQVRFTVVASLPHRCVIVDRVQIEQVLLNLLKNAKESGSPESEIQVAVRDLGQRWRIEVSDRGTGMSDHVLSQALLPFYSTKRGGSGVGLALTREIVEAHQGRIVLRNREDGGLLVAIELPNIAMPDKSI